MPAISATAPGKIILFGEHAVVYGRPAIAVPVHQVQARVMIQAEPRNPSGCIRILAQAINLDVWLADLPREDPLVSAVRGTLTALGIENPPACTIRISSSIPVAAGLGSGAAVSVATIRALSTFLGQAFTDEQVCSLAYEVEKIHHGTPSGIDNTVITYARPVYFVRGQPIEVFQVARPFTIVIGDTGIPSPTAQSVGDLRRRWQVDPTTYDTLFDAAGLIAQAARLAIERGTPEELGPLMDQNHALLQEIGVSSLELDRLVAAARLAGAVGAKLSGGGQGGNMIALATPESADRITEGLMAAGAVRTIVTEVRN